MKTTKVEDYLGGMPARLGRWEVGAKIGGGGMASVYIGRARSASALGAWEFAALKVMRDEFRSDEHFSHMFVDEAKILARLNHRNVIRTVEYGITPPHRFIAMELLSGKTYAEVWELLAERGEKMPWRMVAWLAARVAAGLHSAHELVDDRGSPLSVIHRDVNPSNIFLTYHGGVKLIDFGLAKARQRITKSADGVVKGKLPYLSPEQAHAQPYDRRADIFALGATLWEGVTMKRLFKRATDIDTIRAIREGVVPDPRTVEPDLGEALCSIISRATRRDPNDRFSTAEDFRASLDACIGDASTMEVELATLLERLFPGEEAELENWAQAAISARAPYTMPPPALVPTASSTLLDQGGDDDEREAADERGARSVRNAPNAPDAMEGHSGGRHRLWVAIAVLVVIAALVAFGLGGR